MNFDRDLQSIQQARDIVNAARNAQDALMNFTQEQTDRIIDAMRAAGEANMCRLAEMAVTETGMGIYEDKCMKNYAASRYVYDYIKDMKTVGIIKHDTEKQIIEIAEPLGVLVGIVPTTNPTSTTIYKAIIALKSRNAIVFSPHPSAVQCTYEAARIMNEAAVSAGAPDGVVGCLNIVTMAAANELMHHPDTKCILATGGEGLVRAAYSCGKPALGVGPGNPPVFVERTADIGKTASDIIAGKTFDNGTICASEQSIVVEDCIADELISRLQQNGAYFMNPNEVEKVSAVVINPNFGMNAKTVGKDAQFIAKMAGIMVPAGTKCLVAPLGGVGPQWPLSYEKLTTVLGFYRVTNWQEGCEICMKLVNNGGVGHSLAIHSNNEEVIRAFAMQKPVMRIIVNTPSSLGATGLSTGLAPSFTLGPGTWGGSSISENVTPLNLINIKHIVWPIRKPERPQIKPLQNNAALSAPSVQADGLNLQIVSEVVTQVLKQINSRCK